VPGVLQVIRKLTLKIISKNAPADLIIFVASMYPIVTYIKRTRN